MRRSLTLDDLRTKSTFTELRKAVGTIGGTTITEPVSINDLEEDAKFVATAYGCAVLVFNERLRELCERIDGVNSNA